MENPTHCEFLRYEQREAFTVVGIQEKTLYTEVGTKEKLAAERLNEKSSEIKNTKDSFTYRVDFDIEHTGMTFVLGKAVTKVEDIPEGMVSKEVPAHEYAVICHKGSREKLKDTYMWFYTKLMGDKGYKYNTTPNFYVYDERYIPEGSDTDKSYFEIYISIKKPE